MCTLRRPAHASRIEALPWSCCYDSVWALRLAVFVSLRSTVSSLCVRGVRGLKGRYCAITRPRRQGTLEVEYGAWRRAWPTTCCGVGVPFARQLATVLAAKGSWEACQTLAKRLEEDCKPRRYIRHFSEVEAWRTLPRLSHRRIGI